ncbi:MAG: hypothetical protein ACK4MQ_11370 [Hyphomonas sp.]
MLDLAIRKSERALSRVVFHLFLAAGAMLGLVWLSIAAAGWLALAVSAPAAAAITGLILGGSTALAYLVSRVSRSQESAEAPDVKKNPANDDLISRAARIAERMAPDSPMLALLIALFAGVASVTLPAALNPFLNKFLDDIDRLPDARLQH